MLLPVYAIIQARLGSERLPQKVLKPINGMPMLGYQLERLQTQFPELQLIIATTNEPADQALRDYCVHNNVNFYAGSESDVLDRFYECIQALNLPTESRLIRLTADCPLICPGLIKALLKQYDIEQADYGRIDTDSFPRGVDAEVFTVEMLTEAHTNATSAHEREHVTPYFYRNDSSYRQTRLINKRGNHSHYRLCVDEPDDFRLVTELINDIGNQWVDAGYKQLSQYLEQHPEITSINADVEQRHI